MAARRSSVAITPGTAKYFLLLEKFYTASQRQDKTQADMYARRIERIDSGQRLVMSDHLFTIGYGDD